MSLGLLDDFVIKGPLGIYPFPLINRIARNLLIVVQAHSDDFDFGVSGQALIYQTQGVQIVIVTLSDVTADQASYSFGTSKNLFSADMEYNKADVAPNGEVFHRKYYSRSCGQYRLGNMRERYRKWGFTSLQPKVTFPDGGGFCSMTVQESYSALIRADLELQLANQITKSRCNNIAFYCHDPEIPEHVDHVWAGNLGIALYRLMKNRFSTVEFYPYFFYVDTDGGDPKNGHTTINVKQKYLEKALLYSDIFEYEVPSLHKLLISYNRVPERGHDQWFSNELRKPIEGK